MYEAYSWATRVVLLLSLLYGVRPGATAQTQPFHGPFDEVTATYMHLDPALMPHGVLFQSAYPLVNLGKFNGERPPADKYRLDVNGYGKALFTLGTAVRDESRPALFDLGYREHYAATAESDEVKLTGAIVAGGLLRNAAFANGWVGPNADSTHLVERAGMSAAAYREDTLFIFSPTVDELRSPYVTYQLDASLFYGNIPWPSQLEFDPGDGSGLRQVALGSSISVNYSEQRTAELELRFTANGQTYRAYAKVKVPQDIDASVQMTSTVITDVPGTEIEVEWADPDCQREFTNTLIVVDGIDPSPQQAVVFTTDDEMGAYDKYLFESGDRSVAQHFKDRGYDFAFINFDDGGQSIEATAQILKAAIRYINERRAAAGNTGDNIVIGHSMGGLTAKWALSELARDQEAHQVTKFISFDSPLQGAVVPLGIQLSLQYLLGLEIRASQRTIFLREASPQFQAAEVALNSAAARQLLSYRADVYSFIRVQAWNGSYPRYEVTVDEEEHAAFQRDFDRLYPLDVPHVAIANGSRESDQLDGTLDDEGEITPGGLYYHIDIDQEGEVDNLGDDVSKSLFEHNGYAYSFPDAYHSDTRMRAKWFGIPVLTRRTTATSTHADFGLGRYDLAPGSHGDDGYRELIAAAAPVDQGGQDATNSLQINIGTDHFVFVPTSSALNLPIAFEAPVRGCGPGITECITPESDFLESRFLERTQHHEHVTFTPAIAAGLLRHIPDRGPVGEWAAGTGPSSLTSVYNFAASEGSNQSAPRVLGGPRTVSGGGAFDVNRSGRIRFADEPSNPLGDSPEFELFLGSTSCVNAATDIFLVAGGSFRIGESPRRATILTASSARVRIGSGGRVAIDAGSDFQLSAVGPDGQAGLDVQNGGLVEVRGTGDGSPGRLTVAGGIVRVRSGGTLRVLGDGQIDATDGGRVILEDGARVEFVDPQNPDESDGRLYVGPGGQLELRGEYAWSGPGYLHLDDPNAVTGTADLTMAGDSRTHRRLRTSASVMLAPGQGVDLRMVGVEASSGGLGVRDGGHLAVRYCGITGGMPAFDSDAGAPVLIRNSQFVNGTDGVYVGVSDANAAMAVEIRHCDFVNYEGYGIDLHGAGDAGDADYPARITDCEFVNVKQGLSAHGYPEIEGRDLQFEGVEEKAIFVEDFGRVDIRNSFATGVPGTEFPLVEALDGEEFVLAGGSYTGSKVGVRLEGATLRLSDCVEVSGHEEAAVYGEASTVILAGAQIADSRFGLTGTDLQVHRETNAYGDRLRNTLGWRAVPGVVSYFYYVEFVDDVPPGGLGTVDFTENAWSKDGVPAAPADGWFYSWRGVKNDAYGAHFDNPSAGCGTECDSPACPTFCAANPNAPACDDDDDDDGGVDLTAIVPQTQLWPNPTTDEFNIGNLSGAHVEIDVLRPDGTNVFSDVEDDPGFVIEEEIEDLPPGGYIITVDQEGFTDETGALIPTDEHVVSHHRLLIVD